jgi:hypothetical protein
MKIFMPKHLTSITAGVIILFSILSMGISFGEEGVNTHPHAGPPLLTSGLHVQTPLDFCGEHVPLENQEIRERFEKEMLITLGDRPQIILWLKRSRRYMPIIEEFLNRNGMPNDLKYVALAESALRPHAGSNAGAIGFWQFMKDTGRIYGLRIDSSMDERRNIYTSTNAAITYFKSLYADFNSWTLAAAAFNMGEEGLKTAMLIQHETSFYRLYLPLETQRYLFRIISAKLIMSDPERYGFRLTEEEMYPPLKFERITVECTETTPIRVIARAADTDFKKIKDLNPEIRGYYLDKGVHEIAIPQGAGIDFKTQFDKALSEWLQTSGKRIYVVKQGDSLFHIAERHQVPLPALLIWNNLNPRAHIHPGDRLVIYRPEIGPDGDAPADPDR